MAVSDIANDLAALAGIAEWTWTESTDYTTWPTDGAAGVLLANGGSNFSGTPRAATWVRMWSAGRALGRTVVLSFTHDATTTYTIETAFEGPYVSTTPADLATLLTDLETAINADGDKVVTVSVVGTTLVLVGNGEDPDYGMTLTVSGGSGAIACAAEPLTATIMAVASPGTYGSGVSPGASAWAPVADVHGVLSVSLSANVPDSTALYNVGGLGRFALYASSVSAPAGPGGDTANSGTTISYAFGGAHVAHSTLP